MRLKSIKLSGFKSFVDPTTVDLPSNLCAIVGPNGCGKSNIIDAVRWVMGESSAKNLRGESMTDVIFNGSGGRKPVGQASIELIFDNTDGAVGGEYANFSEISVKRKVTRDSQNLYYLNGHKCRRRDITDIFLGTGLGPRSYAIIEQGMISRLIESKPEELRVFIEEAAGISKYKERRRDTENRMRRTLENMERLTDIRDELERQLQHLHRQAQAAEKYTQLKSEERLLKAQLQAMQWRDLDVSVAERAEQITQTELELEALLTQQTALDAKVEEQFTQQSTVRDNFNDVQAKFYDTGAEIARKEQVIQNKKDRLQSLQQELAMVVQECSQAERLLVEDKDKQEQWQAELEEILPEIELLGESEEGSHELLLNAEQLMNEWQQRWDDFNSAAAQSRQKAEVQQSKIQHAEKVLERIDERVRRFREELADLSAGEIEDEISMLIEQVAQVNMQKEDTEHKLQDIQAAIEQQRQAVSVKSARLDEVNVDLQSGKGRLASLEALQQAALTDQNDALSAWQIKHGLADTELLADKVKVKEGWEQALETVLSPYLQALCFDDFTALKNTLAELEGSSIACVKPVDSKASDTHSDWTSLLSLCDSQQWLASLLQGVYIAEDFSQALAMQAELNVGESVICRDGLWLGQNWLRQTGEQDGSQGVLKRKQEIEQLQANIAELEEEKEHLQNDKAASEQALSDAEKSRDECQHSFNDSTQKYSELSSLLTGKKVKVEQILNRKEQVQRDLQESEEQYKTEQENLAETRGILQQAIETMSDDSEQREELIIERDKIRNSLEQARDRARADKDRTHQLAMKEQGLKNQIDYVQQNLVRTKEQLSQLLEKRGHLELSLAEVNELDDSGDTELEALLDKRLVIEKQLQEARKQVDELEQHMREADRERSTLQQAIEKQRTLLEQSRLASQTWQVQRENLQKQIQEAEFDVQEVIAELPEEANESVWQQNIESCGNRIVRLGAINLAAIDEYKVASERKEYLDAQNEDLASAITTLENAIRKIDKETRLRFKDTFDQINAGVQDLFPKVFGGGRAYLELTGDDLLDTGVAIMAQPPGKRNSTIHLLSGGEKALTAIALVFSIFKLNPAPFCILDEVDAPLDDANVGRYARMVKEMSEQVQFIYITHNKIAMEMADQLLGVTMHEPGCSRLVTVDVNEAAELAAS